MKTRSPMAAGGFFIKEGRSRVYIAFKNLMWLEANGNYTILHIFNEKSRSTRKSLTCLMDELSWGHFIRVHKSYIVQPSCVTEIHANALLIAQSKIPVGRSYKKTVEKFFEGSFTGEVKQRSLAELMA